MCKQLIKEMVEGIREYYGTTNIYELISILDITVMQKKLCKNQKAKTMRNAFGDEYIFISDDVPEHQEKFILAHELGHLLLHKEINCYYYTNSFISKDRLEFQANYFAMELLFPQNIAPYEIEGFTLEQLSVMYEIPIKMLSYKIEELQRSDLIER